MSEFRFPLSYAIVTIGSPIFGHSVVSLGTRLNALEESAARADEFALAGDDDGATSWRRIMAAVTELANKIPPGPIH